MASASPVLQALARFPHTHCSRCMECKETPEQPLLHRQRPRFKEAEFNGTEIATICFLLDPAQFISTYLSSSPDLTLYTPDFYLYNVL